jgi:hypothetical protein
MLMSEYAPAAAIADVALSLCSFIPHTYFTE